MMRMVYSLFTQAFKLYHSERKHIMHIGIFVTSSMILTFLFFVYSPFDLDRVITSSNFIPSDVDAIKELATAQLKIFPLDARWTLMLLWLANHCSALVRLLYVCVLVISNIIALGYIPLLIRISEHKKVTLHDFFTIKIIQNVIQGLLVIAPCVIGFMWYSAWFLLLLPWSLYSFYYIHVHDKTFISALRSMHVVTMKKYIVLWIVVAILSLSFSSGLYIISRFIEPSCSLYQHSASIMIIQLLVIPLCTLILYEWYKKKI